MARKTYAESNRNVGEPAEINGKPAANTKGVRKCLSCGNKFTSEGWHNRLCKLCVASPHRGA